MRAFPFPDFGTDLTSTIQHENETLYLSIGPLDIDQFPSAQPRLTNHDRDIAVFNGPKPSFHQIHAYALDKQDAALFTLMFGSILIPAGFWL